MKIIQLRKSSSVIETRETICSSETIQIPFLFFFLLADHRLLIADTRIKLVEVYIETNMQ
jgi:hypothetical protein